MSWIKALKMWNDSKKDHKNAWCVPKKGTLEYNQVINIMHGINNNKNSFSYHIILNPNMGS